MSGMMEGGCVCEWVGGGGWLGGGLSWGRKKTGRAIAPRAHSPFMVGDF